MQKGGSKVLTFNHQHLFTSDLVFGRITDFAIDETGIGLQLFAGAEASANLARLDLNTGLTASFETPWTLPDRGSTMRVNDIEIIGSGNTAQLLVGTAQSTQIESTLLTTSTSPIWTGVLGGPQTPINQIAYIEIGTQRFLATGSRDSSGMDIYEQSGTSASWTQRDTVVDHAKVALSDTADLISIDVGGTAFLISGATGDGGISTFSVAPNGVASLIDTIGVKQQLWLSGLDDLVGVEAAGVDYVTIAATNSSSLSVVRVNATGVMFVEDHITDTQNSRFANVDALDSFEIGNRGFVVAAGSDDGVSLLEVLPDGQLFHHDSLANHAGGGLENVSALQAAVLGNQVQVFAGTQTGDIVQLDLDVSTLGAAQVGTQNNDTLMGTSADDLLFGDVGNDTLSGGNGDDLLVGGGGTDQMTGGAGADIFVFSKGSGQAQVTDFNVAEDHIDISDWGRLYHISSLEITSRSDGADISFRDQTLRLESHDNSALDMIALTDSFLF